MMRVAEWRKWKKWAGVAVATGMLFSRNMMPVWAEEVQDSGPVLEAEESLGEESAEDIVPSTDEEAAMQTMGVGSEQETVGEPAPTEGADLSASGQDEAEQVSGITWTMDGNTVVITGEGSLEGYGEDWYALREVLEYAEHVRFENSKISGSMYGLFLDLSFLSSVDFSGLDTSEVTNMGSMLFGCSSLTSVDMSDLELSNVTNMASMFRDCTGLVSVKLDGVNTSQVTDMSYMFKGCRGLTSIDLSGVDTSRVTNMENMFANCSRLNSLNISGFNTSRVTNMCGMFENCGSLEGIDVSFFDTSSVTDMSSMFQACQNLKSVDVSNFDTSCVMNMESMFRGCSSLTGLDVSGFVTPRVTGMGYMFDGCNSLESIDLSGFDTSHVISLESMFSDCSNLKTLDLSGFDTPCVMYMSRMFHNCSSLDNLDLSSFDTSQVIYMSYLFDNCSSLTNIDVSSFNTSMVVAMDWMFSNCSSLTNIDVSGFNISRVKDMLGMFYGCSSLTSIDMGGFDMSQVTEWGKVFIGCNELKIIKTPKIMTSITTDLPATFIDSDGKETQTLGQDFCNTTLTRKDIAPTPVKVAPVNFTVVGAIGGRNVTFNTDSQDAVIYYSSKTSSLTTADTCVKPGETVLFENFYGTIYAKAYANGQWSNVSRLVLKIPVVNKPTITSKDGVVTIKTTTPDSYIYYTTDGSTPSPTNGTMLAKSGGSFTVPANCIVKAIAVRSCFTNSEVVSASVTAKKLGAPSFVVKGVIGGREVTFNSTEAWGEIYYSFTTSNITTKDLHVKPGEKVLFQNYYGTVYAKTYVNGQWSNASRLILKIPVVNTPTITAAGAGKVKISTSTPNCAIYYTTDGSTPSPTNGTKINSSSSIVTVGSGKTVKAIAVRSCFTNSDVATYR